MPGGFSSGFSGGFGGEITAGSPPISAYSSAYSSAFGGVAPPDPPESPPGGFAGQLNFHVEIAFSSVQNPDAWALGVSPFPTTLADPTTYVWSDVTPYCVGISVTRGKSKELDPYSVGRLSLRLRNQTRMFDPLNLAGPYVSGGVTQIKPGKPVRVRVTDPAGSVLYYLFRGTIKDWDLDYGADYEAFTVALASDAIADLLAGVNLTTPAGTAGPAISAILADAGIGALAIDVGNTPVQAMTFTGTAGQAARVLEQTEQGHLYSDAEGGISFRGRQSLAVNPRSSTPQLSFGGGAAGLPYEKLGIAYESDAIKNKARVTRTGGVLQEAVNAASVAAYGERLIALTGMASATDTDALDLATYLVGFRGEPVVRFTEITFASDGAAGSLSAALSTRLLDRLRVWFMPPGATAEFYQDVIVIGITHTWSPPAVMKTTFRFMPTDAVPSAVWFLGVGELGDTTGPTATVLTY